MARNARGAGPSALRYALPWSVYPNAHAWNVYPGVHAWSDANSRNGYTPLGGAATVQSDSKATAKRQRSDGEATAQRQRSDSEATAKRQQSDCEATAKRQRSDSKVTAKSQRLPAVLPGSAPAARRAAAAR
eukprot:gene16882-biopygen6350